MSVHYKIIALVSLSTLLVGFSFISWSAFEPLVLRAQESVDITVTQTITGETSFTTDPGNVVMDTSIASITGGTSNGTTTFTVQSNNSSGYNVTLAFAQDPAMQQDTGSANIPDYLEDTPGVPDYGFDSEAPGGSAQFGFSVYSASSTLVANNFQDDNASACGGGGGFNQYAQCWSAASTTALTILDRSSATDGAGDDGNVLFRVHVPANPSPGVPADDYTATATLTVSENP